MSEFENHWQPGASAAPDQYTSYKSWNTILLNNLVCVAILPIVIYHFASSSMPIISALLLAALPSALYTAFVLMRYRRLNLLGVLSLLSIAIKLISALIFKDARLLLISDSLITGVNGVILLVSLLFAQPLLLILARNMLASTPSAPNKQRTDQWQEPRHRAFFTLLTAVIGAGLLIEFVARLILVYTLSTELFLVVSPIVHYGLFGILLLWLVLFIRRRRQGQQHEPVPQQEASHL